MHAPKFNIIIYAGCFCTVYKPHSIYRHDSDIVDEDTT